MHGVGIHISVANNDVKLYVGIAILLHQLRTNSITYNFKRKIESQNIKIKVKWVKDLSVMLKIHYCCTLISYSILYPKKSHTLIKEY